MLNWENLDRVATVLSIVGISLIPIIKFLAELIKARKPSSAQQSSLQSKFNYQTKNLLSCFTGCLVSIVSVVGFNIFSALLYSSIAGRVPDYSLGVYILCAQPIVLAVMGGLIGLGVGKRYL